MEFTEAESNMNDLVSEYQQYQEAGIEEEDGLIFFEKLTNYFLLSKFKVFLLTFIFRRILRRRRRVNSSLSVTVESKKNFKNFEFPLEQ